jgi:hypothetical protein
MMLMLRSPGASDPAPPLDPLEVVDEPPPELLPPELEAVPPLVPPELELAVPLLDPPRSPTPCELEQAPMNRATPKVKNRMAQRYARAAG